MGERPSMASQLCSTNICSQLINIETTLSETFTPHSQHPPNSANSTDYFSQHFKNVIESVPTASISPGRDGGHEDNQHLTAAGPVRHSSSQPQQLNSSTHRVTFNDKNEVACQDTDGSFTVTYSQLGEKISQKKTEGLGLKVQYGERSSLDFPQLRLSEQPRNVTFNEESFQSYKSSKTIEEWDNPFQPEGEVSQDADLIIQLWKGGKLAETEDLQENLKSLVLETEKESDLDDDTDTESNENVDDDPKHVNGVNGFKPASPTKKPVINSSDVGYLVMINGPEKHKNKIKKHCNLM